MKAKSLILTILIAALVSVLSVTVMLPDGQSGKEAVKETAYERVMRTGLLRCGYYIWPPFYDLDPNTGALTGLNRDFVDATASLLGINVEYTHEIVLGQQVEEFRRGNIDAICGDGAWVIAASKRIDFTTPYAYAPVYAYGRKADANQTDMNTAQIKFIGLDGDLSQELARARYPQAIHQTLSAMSTPADLMLHVTGGKADYVVIDPISVSEFEASNGDVLSASSPAPLGIYPIGFSVEKGQSDLIRMLNIGIDAANNLGIYADIMTRYPELQNMIYLGAPRYQEPAP